MREPAVTTRVREPAVTTRVRLLVSLIAFGLGGCAVNRTSHHDLQATAAPTPLPALAAGPAATLVPGLAIDRWWTLFGDAALDRLVDQALQHNHDLAAAAARVHEARAQLDEARGAQTPTLDLQARTRRARQATDGLPPGVDRTVSSHGVSLVAGYEVDLWGRLAAGSDAARQRLLAQEWARAALQWSLTAQIAEGHFTLRAVQRQIEISEAVRTGRARTVHLRQREHAAGAASEFELRRAEAELAGTDATLTSLRRRRVALEGTLALLAGRPVHEVTMVEAPRVPLDPATPFAARLPQGDASALLVRRPDLRQAEAGLAASRADIAAARAATLPALRLSGSAGSDVRSLSNLFDGPGFVWSLAAGVAQSVLDGGQAQARVDAADARADAALADYRQVVLAAVLELREAYAALELNEQALRAERERVAALERARELARLGVDAGALGQLDLLDAERNAFQAQLDEAAATRDRLVGQIAAFKALGGGHPGIL
jgi:multidrug efflux system outer membrane protein